MLDHVWLGSLSAATADQETPDMSFDDQPRRCTIPDCPQCRQAEEQFREDCFRAGLGMPPRGEPWPHSVPGGFAAKITETVANRGSGYGHPQDNHQLTADLWSAWLKRRLGVDISLSAEDVCALNVLQKLSRAAHATKDDTWEDVAGYAENVAMLARHQRNNLPRAA